MISFANKSNIDEARDAKNFCHVREDSLEPACFANSFILNGGYSMRFLRRFLLHFFLDKLSCSKNRAGLLSLLFFVIDCIAPISSSKVRSLPALLKSFPRRSGIADLAPKLC